MVIRNEAHDINLNSTQNNIEVFVQNSHGIQGALFGQCLSICLGFVLLLKNTDYCHVFSNI